MKLTFTTLTGAFAIARLPADAECPSWANGPGLSSVTRAEDELSIVCPFAKVPASVQAEHGWSAIRVDTLADLDAPGVVMAAVTPISTAGLGVFVISTHLRDYLLVRTSDLMLAQDALVAAGHHIA